MNVTNNIKKSNKSIASKIIITSLLALAAVFSSVYVSRFTFSRILSTTQQLSQPNVKIQLVNTLFRDVVQLDQLQRNRELKAGPLQFNPFLKEAEAIQLMLDSLRVMYAQDQAQVVRIDSMKNILERRDLLFLRYIKLRADLEKDDVLAMQVKKLSELIASEGAVKNGNRITTTRDTKTVIDTIQPEEQKRSLWKRIFTKRKKSVAQVQKKIVEDLKVQVDTMGLSDKGDSIAKTGDVISKVETSRIAGSDRVKKQQQELNATGDALIAKLIRILNDIEHDELLHASQQNAAARQLVNKGIVNISVILIIFIVAAVVLIFFIFTDISKSSQYRLGLIAAKEEAEEAGRVKQRFLANMSHELRTPLQIILGTAEQIRSADNPGKQDVENIYRSSTHLLQIVNEVLDYSKITSGTYTIEHVDFNMYDILAEVREMVRVQAKLNGLGFNFDMNVNENGSYLGDPFRLKQVLLNLLGNAIKFTEEGSVSCTVDEHHMADGTSEFTFTITDTGIGIAQEDLSVIFNQFEQGSSADIKKGTGLGLSIVKALVDMQNGKIRVQSNVGEGSTFFVTLSYKHSLSGASKIAPMAKANVGFDGHVWVVDDDVFILQLCSSIFTKRGVAHTCFSSALEALATKFSLNIKTVFLDIRMKEMDGIELCRQLKEKNSGSQPAYIALTAQALPDERTGILEKGFDGLVLKPFLEADLIGAVYKGMTPFVPDAKPDLSSILKMTGNDSGLLKIVLESFVNETEKDIEVIKTSIANNDSFSFADALHKLATRCGQVGFDRLASQLRDMEIELRNGRHAAFVGTEMDDKYPQLMNMCFMIIDDNKIQG